LSIKWKNNDANLVTSKLLTFENRWGFFYGYGLIADNNKTRKLAVKLTEAAFLSTSLTLITKTIIGRGRPYVQESQYS